MAIFDTKSYYITSTNCVNLGTIIIKLLIFFSKTGSTKCINYLAQIDRHSVHIIKCAAEFGNLEAMQIARKNNLPWSSPGKPTTTTQQQQPQAKHIPQNATVVFYLFIYRFLDNFALYMFILINLIFGIKWLAKELKNMG